VLGLLGLLGRAPSLAAAEPEPPSAAVVSAGSTPGDAMRRAQRMLLERAKQRFEEGRGAGEDARPHLEGALDALDLAYRLDPAAWLLFNMAQVQSRLGRCSEAAELYQRFLASDPEPAARTSAEAALQLLGSCDEASRELPGEDGLSPGLWIPSSLDTIFAAQGVASPSPPPAVAAGSTTEGSVVAALPWAFGSLAVISGVTGSIFWSGAVSAKRDLDRLRIAGPDVVKTRERGESAQALARVFGGLSAGFALAAGVSYWWLQSDRAEAPLAAALGRFSVSPIAGGAGACYRSEF
jgi:tetratricopeptide (TPR) repeat protein